MLKILMLPMVVLAVAASACADDGDETATTTPLLGSDTTVDPGAGAGADAELRVVLGGGEFDDLHYTITCAAGGAVVEPEVPGVDAVTACQQLQDPDVVRRLVDGPAADRICTEVYGGPQVATITGAIDGQAVDTQVSRTNGCEIDTWDRLLTGVLPPTEGVAAGE